MSKRDHDLLLADMLESTQRILRYTSNYSFSDFVEDDKTSDAVIRNFEIIGEAANRINDEFKIVHPEIPWARLRGFRNRIVHDYFGIDYQIVWTIITEEIPHLVDFLGQLRKD